MSQAIHTTITTPREQLEASLKRLAAEHGVQYERLFGDGKSGRTTPLIHAARQAAIMAVIEARPWWPYQQVADYFDLCLNAIHKHAAAAGHRRNRPYPQGHGKNPNRYRPNRAEGI